MQSAIMAVFTTRAAAANRHQVLSCAYRMTVAARLSQTTSGGQFDNRPRTSGSLVTQTEVAVDAVITTI